MFGISADEKKYFLDRFQELPSRVLAQRYNDGGKMAAKYLYATLELWAAKHAQYNDVGKLLAKPDDSTNGLLGYFGLKETDKHVGQIQPWQVFDGFGASSNFELIYKLMLFPYLDEDGLIQAVSDELSNAIFWATAITHLAEKADLGALINVHINFTNAYVVYEIAEHHKTIAAHHKTAVSKLELLMSVEPMRQAFELQENRKRNFVRSPDKQKAQILREKTDKLRSNFPKRSRNWVATELAKDTSIGLQSTRIKEYLNQWFPESQWPKDQAGRRPKPIE
jgi:hypothetical protein